MSDALNILKKHFGYDTFRPMQEEIIQTVLNKQDCLVLMPTGGGKSITFQIPALLQNGLTIVISPLIALMKDQVESLQSSGITAAFLNSTQSADEQQFIEKQVITGVVKLLYVSPEKLLTKPFYDFLQQTTVELFAVDEAHCISQWGHNFRPEYTKLKFLKHYFPDVPIIALTATADKITARDIVKQLRFKNHKQFVASFNRENLSLNVTGGTGRMAKILDFIDKRPGESGIIYCLSRKSTEQVAASLKKNGINAAFYHAQVPAKKRAQVQEDFINDNIPIICATIAFGMGIDKSNVRWVIHYNMPKNIEGYYQEIGRAGRDGIKSDTLMFYSYRDVMVYRDFIERAEHNTNAEVEIAKLQRMQEYAEAQTCRRKILLSYFGEYLAEDCGNCDVCNNPPQSYDGTRHAQMALSAIYRLNQQVGIGTLIDVLRGSGRYDILNKGYHQIKTYGAGKNISYFDWQQIVLQLINQGLIEIAYDQNHVLKLTEASKEVLFEGRKIKLVKVEELKRKREEQKKTIKPLSKAQQQENELFERLRIKRKILAREAGVPPHVIFNDATLKALSKSKPTSTEHLTDISGIGEHKQKVYGQIFVDEILNFMKEKDAAGEKIKGATYEITYAYYRDGLSIEQIALKRNLKTGTVTSHLLKQYESGKDVDILRIMTQKEFDRIVEAYAELSRPETVRPVYEKLNEEIDYSKIQFVMLYLKKQQI